MPSGWARARSHLARHWLPWLVVAVVGTALSYALSLAMPAPLSAASLGTVGAAVAYAGYFGQVLKLLLVEIVVGSFLGAGFLGLLLDAAAEDRGPALGRFFAQGWRLWSWMWRGIGFAFVLGLGVSVAFAVLAVLVGLVAAVGHAAAIAVTVVLLLAYVLLFAVGMPIFMWTFLAAFAFRPDPYFRTLGRTWLAFLRRPGRILGVVWAEMGVALALELPLMLAAIEAAFAGPLAAPPSYHLGLGSAVVLLLIFAFAIFVYLTMLFYVGEWPGRADPAPTQPSA